MERPPARRHLRGFTLAESLVTLGILGTLLALAVSTVGDVLQSIRLANAANEVLQHLYVARSEAIKRNGRVAVCKAPAGEACVAHGGWEQGWIVFQDANNNGLREPAEPVLRRLPPLPPDFRVQANTNVARYVSYGPYGNTRLASGAFQAGTFTVCRASAEAGEGRQIVINSMGRPRVQKVQLASCI